MVVAQLAGDASGFALRKHWLWSGVAHDGVKRLSWVLVLVLCAAVWWPFGPFRLLPMSRRLELAIAPVLAGVAVSGLKAFSLTSCPWDLQAFGGIARHISHWNFSADGGSGHCFPGGHAAHGFSMMAGYFVFRDVKPDLAKRWLAGALISGLVLGLVQQWRGAHFMSHTLWTGWFCWVVLWVLDMLWRRAETRRPMNFSLSQIFKREAAPSTLVIAASVWMAGLGNFALWRELTALGLLQGLAGWGLALAMGVLMAGVLTALMTLVAWGRSVKPIICLMLVMTSLASYFMLAYGVVIDPSMITNTLQTDVHEAGALFSPWLVVSLVLLAVLPGLIVWRITLKSMPWQRLALRNLGTAGAALALALLVALAAFQPLSSAMRNHKHLRYLMNPLNSVWALGRVATEPLRRSSGELEAIALDAQAPPASARPPLLVLVLGETARSANFSLNGYARPTNTELEKRGAISFANAWSCGTSTAASVPCMFSAIGREGFADRPRDQENVLDVLQRAGLAVMWIDNQSGCKGVCERIPNVNVSTSQHPTLCASGECLDGILLEGLDAQWRSLPAERRARGTVLVLHTMGSHGPAYSKRSPPSAKKFLPECTTVNLQDCSKEGLLNAYDNSIAYTDQVLGGVIDWLKTQEAAHDTAMVYLSDHGESLGEKNIYLHGMPYAFAPEVQKKIPWVTWLSPGFAKSRDLHVDCLRARAQAEVTHDYLFHSLIGLMRVQTQAYRSSQDAYDPCVQNLHADSRTSNPRAH